MEEGIVETCGEGVLLIVSKIHDKDAPEELTAIAVAMEAAMTKLTEAISLRQL